MPPRFMGKWVGCLAFLLSVSLPALPGPASERASADPPEVSRWIRQLSDADFQRREAASRALEQIGEPAGPALCRAAGTSDDQEVRWRAAQVIQAVQLRLARAALVLRGDTVNISSVAFSPDGTQLLYGGRDGTVRVWDVATGQPLQSFHAGGIVTDAVFSAAGKQVFAANHETLFLWETATGKELRRIRIPEGANRIFLRAALAPDGRRALTGQQDGSFRLWDLRTGKEVYRVQAHCGGHTEAVAFTPDGQQALTSGWDGTAALWDVATGKQRRRFAGGHSHNILPVVAPLPDGKRMLTVSPNSKVTRGELCLWDLASGKLLRGWQGHTRQINAVAFSPAGRHLLTASHDTTVRLWEVSTGHEVCCFHGHTQPVETVAWSPAGRWAASAGQDCTIRRWRMLAE